MFLNKNLLNIIGKKLKQPYNCLDLELSGNSFIDNHLKYYLTKTNEYNITGKSNLIYSEYRIVKYLIQRGANPSHFHSYAFKIACLKRNIKVVKLLVKHEVDINCKPGYCKGSFKIFKYLFNNGLIISSTLPFKATQENQIKICKFLFRNDLVTYSIYIQLFHYSCKIGNIKVLKILPKKFINTSYHISLDLDTLFKPMCKSGYLPVIKFLVKKGFNFNNEDFFISACLGGKIETVKYLFNIVKLNSDGIGKALIASSHKYLKIVKFLTQKESRDGLYILNKDLVASLDYSDGLALFIAYRNNQKEIIDYFESIIQG